MDRQVPALPACCESLLARRLAPLRRIAALGLAYRSDLEFRSDNLQRGGLPDGIDWRQAPLAAHAIAIQIASIAFMVPMGFGQAATVRIGRAYGAQDREGIKRAGWVAFASGTGFMVVTALLMLLAPHQLISAFIDINDPANSGVVSLAVTFLAFAALFQIFDGGQAVASGMLRGLHDTTIPMIYAAIAYWGIGLPFSVGFGFWLGMDGAGIWLGLLTRVLPRLLCLLISRWLRREKLGDSKSSVRNRSVRPLISQSPNRAGSLPPRPPISRGRSASFASAFRRSSASFSARWAAGGSWSNAGRGRRSSLSAWCISRCRVVIHCRLHSSLKLAV